jgi:hypothetical protein
MRTATFMLLPRPELGRYLESDQSTQWRETSPGAAAGDAHTPQGSQRRAARRSGRRLAGAVPPLRRRGRGRAPARSSLRRLLRPPRPRACGRAVRRRLQGGRHARRRAVPGAGRHAHACRPGHPAARLVRHGGLQTKQAGLAQHLGLPGRPGALRRHGGGAPQRRHASPAQAGSPAQQTEALRRGTAH